MPYILMTITNDVIEFIDNCEEAPDRSMQTKVNEIASEDKLFNLYPNPNNGKMVLKYNLAAREKGAIAIYDIKQIEMRSLLVFTLILISFDQFGQGKMGVNLSGDRAFVNIMNEGSRFDNVTSYDAQGWPNSNFTQTFDWRLVAEWSGPADDPEQYRINMSGIYKCSFIGQATVTVNGAAKSNHVYTAGTNITTFDVTVSSTNNGRIFWQIVFSNTKKTSSSATNTGIAQLKINRPGYPLSSTQTFTTEYINLCTSASFACYRYYTVNNVWDGTVVFPAVSTWSNRKLPTDANQANMLAVNGKVEGWCWEYVIELANILNKDIWINLNVCVDDNYITSLATKLQAELNPGINIYVEYGNEVWDPNWHVQDKWINDQAINLGIGFNENYARNVVRMSNLFKNVYGAAAINSKIRVVLGAQQGWLGRSTIHLNYIQNNIGAPKNYIWALSPSTYFNGAGTSIEEALNECHTSIMKEYDDVNDDPSLLKFMQVANTWALPGVCVSYEGQEHANIGSTATLAVDIGKHRDARMATEQYVNFQSFFNSGGTLACQFTIWGQFTRYGCWGLTDDPSNPDRNFKFKSARTLCGDVVNAMPIPAMPAAPTCLIITTVSGTEKKLDWIDNANTEDGYEIWSKENTSSVWKYYSTVGPNKTTATFTHTAGKTYTFRVRAYNFSQWSVYNQPCSSVGIADVPSEALEFSIYPNPSIDEVNVYFNSPQTNNIKLIISDLLSHEILISDQLAQQGSNTFKLNMVDLSNGIYFITLLDGDKTSIQKMIVNK
ncbi:MAG: T9SS type A sorting domain-containing protein [Bacteroidota bacterium]